MYPLEFETWADLFLDYYILSVIICIIAIISTLALSFIHKNPTPEEIEIFPEEISSEERSEEEAQVAASSTQSAKHSQTLDAERIIRQNMTEEQRFLEQEVQQKQLSQIYELMQQQSDIFGEMSLSEVEEQFKLYQ